MQSRKHNKRWDSLYAIAVKAYELEGEQARKYKAWRQAQSDRINAGDEAYLRPATFDALLSALFPKIAEGIGRGYGRLTEQKLKARHLGNLQRVRSPGTCGWQSVSRT